MDPEFLKIYQNGAYVAITLLVMATLYMLFGSFFEGDKKKKRMQSVANQRENLRKSHMKHLNENKSKLRTNQKTFSKRLVDQLSLEKLLEASNLKDKLAQAGLRGQKPIYTFYLFRFILPLVMAFAALVLFFGMNVGEMKMQQKLLSLLLMTALGFYLPVIYIKQASKKRNESISRVFPDALDLLLICVESGMSVEMAFDRVSKELSENSVELAEELSLTKAELSYLQNRRQAYENLARRNNSPGIRSVSTALIQTERYGTPLGDTLRTLATENRQMRVMAAEKKAASLPAKLTVPMILCFLPVLFIVILTPAAMRMTQAF